MAKMTVRMMVTFGVPSKIDGKEMTTMDAVDRGATRSVGDQLTIQHGLKHGSITASVCSAVGSLCFGERTRRLSVGQTLEILREFEPAVTYVIEHRSKAHGLRSSGVLAGFAFALATEEGIWDGKTPINDMFERLNLGERLEDESPIKALRTFLTSEEAKLLTRSLDRGMAELVLQAILLELKGAKVSKLEMALDGANHFRELQRERAEKVAALFKLPEVNLNGLQAESKKAEKPSLSRILAVVENHFRIAEAIIKGKGTDPDVVLPRAMFVTLALGFGYQEGALALILKRNVAQVLELQWPKSRRSERQEKIFEKLRERLGG